VVLPRGRRGRIDGLMDSKLLTPRRREQLYAEIVERAASWAALVIPSFDIDKIGLHKCNIAGMRRAVARLDVRPRYVLSDGFRVPGLGVPTLSVPKGDQVAACIAAASVIAKVTRDRLMGELHERYPVYGFSDHKGYVTRGHSTSLIEHGPCPEHRFSFVNVAGIAGPRLLSPGGRSDLVGPDGGPRAGRGTELIAGVGELLVMEEVDAAGSENGLPVAGESETGVPEDMNDGVLASGDESRS
jgi:ribonuclease HII